MQQIKPLVSNASKAVMTSLRDKTMLWAGIATAAGLALGIGGRVALSRRKKAARPKFLIVREAC